MNSTEPIQQMPTENPLNSLLLPSYLGRLDNRHFKMPPHLKLLEKYLWQIASGQLKRLIVCMPPRHGKSELISKYFTAWYLIKHPDKRVQLVGYGDNFIAGFGRKIRNLIKNFGYLNNVFLSPDSSAVDKFAFVGSKGEFYATGVAGEMTGRGCDLFIIDDPVKNQSEALSTTYRDRIMEWFSATAYTRLEPGGAMIIIMTRWHSDDLVGRILKEYPEDWTVLNLPAVAKEDDVLGRAPGEALWPQRFDKEALADIKKVQGAFWFSALYQQEPIAGEYQIFKPQWWQFYDESPQCSYIFQTWDTAFKDGEKNDYSACQTWGVFDHKLYLLDAWRGKVLFPELKRIVKALHAQWQPKRVLMENAASGQDLIPTLKKEAGIPIYPVTPMNKVIRAHSVSPLLEDGKIFIPHSASWISDYMNEHSEFPSGAHDDWVDCTTMALDYGRKFTTEKHHTTTINRDNLSISRRRYAGF